MRRLIDYLSEKFFGLVFKLIWKFIRLIFVGPLAPFILGRELWKVWYPRGVLLEKKHSLRGELEDEKMMR